MTRVVVAGAVLRAGRVLAARRVLPAELAGQWEFPGGKVEAGESDADALVRELREELGIEVMAGPVLAETQLAGGATLRLLSAELLFGEKEARFDHDEVRWLTVAEMAALPWVSADEALLPAVAAALRP